MCSSQRTERESSGEAGFTMVDVVVTLAMFGIILGFGITVVDTSVWKLDASASQVAQRARVARSLAVLRQHDVVVTFDETKRALFVHEDANNNGTQDDGERVVRYALESGIRFTRGSAPAYGGYTSGAITFSGGVVTFRRNGSASEEGAIYIGRGSDDDRPKVVVLHRSTGYTETLKYDGSGWVKP